MADTELRLEALSAILGRPVKSHTDLQKTSPAQTGPPLLQPQDVINIIFGKISADDFVAQLTSLLGSVHLSEAEAIRKELFVNVNEFFDPPYDWDFTHTNDGAAEFKRGGERYKRPCGWKRLALKVRGKYQDGDGWLGMGPDAWPVSYHGTSIENAKGIIETHYTAGPRGALGRGIYSTPDVDAALVYSKEFTSQSTNKTYNVILQNRVNPKNRERISNYWWVPVPEGTAALKEEEISKNSIRPYGLLLREVRS